MAIDLTKPETYQKLTVEDLFKDAVERHDEAALTWLAEHIYDTVERKMKNSEAKTIVDKPINSLRKEYLKEFHGYEPATKKYSSEAAKAAAKARRLADKQQMVAKYYAKFNNLEVTE